MCNYEHFLSNNGCKDKALEKDFAFCPLTHPHEPIKQWCKDPIWEGLSFPSLSPYTSTRTSTSSYRFVLQLFQWNDSLLTIFLPPTVLYHLWSRLAASSCLDTSSSLMGIIVSFYLESSWAHSLAHTRNSGMLRKDGIGGKRKTRRKRREPKREDKEKQEGREGKRREGRRNRGRKWGRLG